MCEMHIAGGCRRRRPRWGREFFTAGAPGGAPVCVRVAAASLGRVFLWGSAPMPR